MAYAFETQEDLARAAKAIRYVESLPKSPATGKRPSQPVVKAPIHHHIRVTSATPTDIDGTDYYPGRIQGYSSGTASDFGTCWVRHFDNDALTTTTYPAALAGIYSGDSLPLYVTIPGESGGGAADANVMTRVMFRF